MAKSDDEQMQLIETDHPAHAKFKRLAKDYLKKKREWVDAGKPVQAAKQRLIDAMHEEGQTHFRIADLEIKLVGGKESVKVTTAEEENEEAAEEEEGE